MRWKFWGRYEKTASNAVVLMTDQKTFPAALFLARKLTGLNPRSDTKIIVFSDWKAGIGEGRPFASKVDFRDCNFEEPDYGKHNPSFWEKTSYFRFCLPRLLPEIERILYVDVDMHVTSSRLFGLFDLDLRGHEIAAVRDLYLFRQRLLNGGTLLLDADVYRRAGSEEKAFQIVRSQETLSTAARDQIILNKMYRHRWLELSPCFNLVTRYMNTELARAFPPELLHFIGQHKQWSYPSYAQDHAAHLELKDFLRETPWSDFIGSPVHWPDHWDWPLVSLSQLGTLKMLGLAKLLRTTEFADVSQGLTKPQLDHLPTVKTN